LSPPVSTTDEFIFMLLLCMTTYTVFLLLINEYREYGNMYNYTELTALNNFNILLEIEIMWNYRE